MSGTSANLVRDKLGARTERTRLFELALTHSSHGGDSYERLEFLGDRVLGHWSSPDGCTSAPDEPEG